MPKRLVFASLTLLTLSTVTSNAMTIRNATYAYSVQDIAPVLRSETFVICPCDPLPDLSFKFQTPPLALRMPTAIIPSALAHINDTEIREEMIPTKPSTPAGNESAELEQVFYFSWDSDTLPSEEIDRLMDWVPRLKQMKVDVIGHADPIGSPSYNTHLSHKRARAVARVLRQGGVEMGEVKGVGSCCPMSDRAKLNRRVEVRAYPLEGGK